MVISNEAKKALLKLARDSIAYRFTGIPPVKPTYPELQEKRGVFVTLNKHGQLRGCIGYIQGYKSIVDSVIEMAQAAAFEDPRFPPLRQSELPELEIEISILGDLIPVNNIDEIVIGRDGLYIQHPYGSGIFLPQVPLEWNWDLPTYLKELCRKAGLNDKDWMDPRAQLFRFEAEVFSESEF